MVRRTGERGPTLWTVLEPCFAACSPTPVHVTTAQGQGQERFDWIWWVKYRLVINLPWLKFTGHVGQVQNSQWLMFTRPVHVNIFEAAINAMSMGCHLCCDSGPDGTFVQDYKYKKGNCDRVQAIYYIKYNVHRSSDSTGFSMHDVNTSNFKSVWSSWCHYNMAFSISVDSSLGPEGSCDTDATGPHTFEVDFCV